MGLDTFAAYGPAHALYVDGSDNCIPDELFPNNYLCGGGFSNGINSFRGKVYNNWIEWCTNGQYTLYTEELSENQVKDIYEALYRKQEEYDFKDFEEQTGNRWEISYTETQRILKWFEVVVKNKGIVINWW
jgi:hypothetical protein